jgi:hypothetical protein
VAVHEHGAGMKGSAFGSEYMIDGGTVAAL